MGYVRTDKDLDRELHDQVVYDAGQGRTSAPRDAKTTARVLTGGSSLELLGGLAAMVVAVIGVASYLPFYMSGIATIAIGVALLAHGLSVIARWADARRRLEDGRYDQSELIGGITTEVFGGAIGIVLGILALLNVSPAILLPVAAIVFGGSLLLGGSTQPELADLAPADERHRRLTQDAVQASGGIMALVGIAAAVLGILALLQVGPVITLTLVAMLCVGASLVLAGGALTARFVRRFA